MSRFRFVQPASRLFQRGSCAIGLVLPVVALLSVRLAAQENVNWQALADASVAAGFTVEQIHEVRNSEGSWVSLTVDSRGRLIASDQYGGLFRITLDLAARTTEVEPIPVNTGRAHGLLCAFDSLYVMSHAGDDQPSGLYRVRDTDGDDQYDQVELLVQLEGDGEHGPHAIVLSPDGQSIVFCCGNHTLLPGVQRSRVPEVWQEDEVLPRLWDPNGHAVNIMAPGGYIIQCDPDGRELELLSIGYRNQYDIAFSPAGELFTYDSDMEWDVGTPWYRPTRVCHATSGSEFGWRSGSSNPPEYAADTLPPVINIGFGSPTGIAFGTGAKFPAKYRDALFIADWSYGVVHAVHLKPAGGSFSGERETLVAAPGLAVTDMAVNPLDGALYFAIGGRRSRSALYRVSWTGQQASETADSPDTPPLHLLRRELESLHRAARSDAAQVIAAAAPQFSHADRFVRFAARAAVERMPCDAWRDQALNQAAANPSLTARIEWALAVARCGEDADRVTAVRALLPIDWAALNTMQRLAWLRTIGVAITRMNQQNASLRGEICKVLEPLPAGDDWRCDAERMRLLVAAGSDAVVAGGIELLETAPTQEQQMHCFYCLSHATAGWTPELRRRYFAWYLTTGRMRGGNSFASFLFNIRAVAIGYLDDEAKRELGDLLTALPDLADPQMPAEPREFVRKWTMEDFTGIGEADLRDRDLVRGQQMFVAGQCFQCHRVQDNGGSVGPDLTPSGRRFNPHDLLETLIQPSKAVSDQYQATVFQLEDGRTVTGRIANLNTQTLYIQTNMLDPGNFTQISDADVIDRRPATLSMMPEGLLDTMSRDEILDLLAWMRSAADQALQQQGTSVPANN